MKIEIRNIFLIFYFTYRDFICVLVSECNYRTSYKICLYSATAQHAGDSCSFCKAEIHKPSFHISCK